MTSYIELQTTTNFSFLRGGSHPEELVLQAAALGLGGIAITDRNTLAGVVRGHVAARGVERSGGAPFRYLVGARLDLQPEAAGGRDHSLLCLPTDRAAYGRLSTLLSRGQRCTVKGDCRLWLDDLLADGAGLITLALPPDGLGDDFIGFLRRLREGYGDQCFLAASHRYRGDDAARIEALAGLASAEGTPLVATNDVHYHLPERRRLQDVLTCIREGCTIDAAGYRLLANAERHLKPPAEMARLFRDHPEALERSAGIAGACGFSLDELAYDYPIDPVPSGLTPDSHLARLAFEGAGRRYPDGVPARVQDLLRHELDLIEELRYAP
jgi:error-prone DNA polymerase